MNKKVIILGGGTFNHIRAHLSLAAPAFGETARKLAVLSKNRFDKMDIELVLTKMADSNSNIITNSDVELLVDDIINDNTVKVVFFNVALCDYDGSIDGISGDKYATRLNSSQEKELSIKLTPSSKIISKIRKTRKDIFLVGFKTTCFANAEEQFAKGLNLLKKASCNLVMVNDIGTRENFIVTPEEGVYMKGSSRDECLAELVEIAWLRTHLSFTRSTVVDGKPVVWNGPDVPNTLRTVVNWCISQGAYKTFNGVTTGHFAAKLGPTEFLTSIRKTNFNEIEKHGMVRVTTDGEDSVISYGAKPSVGGQSQRIIFGAYPNTDCIVHFHCPLRKDAKNSIPIVSQKEYECGSHQCGTNTKNGLKEVVPGIHAVMLDNHGPNIVFHHSIKPEYVIQFISDNFELNKSTSGFEKVYLELT